MSILGADTQLETRNYYTKKTKTEYEYQRLATKCAILTGVLVITNIITLIFLVAAYLPRPCLK